MKVLLLLSVFCLYVNSLPVNDNEFTGKKWVVLVAGSKGWENYRHQSDIYHAYQIMHANGIPDENIIVFHYDDIANNQHNKYPGKVINWPKGPDVYHDVPKDYTGKEVTPENFLKVLAGDKELENAGKKVLKSGPDDHVFVFFDDHGSPDLVCFPETYLYASNLTQTLKDMHKNNKYSKLVFYIEACESGSMFYKHLPTDINIYATTASLPDEGSWDMYPDTFLGTSLADLYSERWMEFSEQHDLRTATLQEQFDYTMKMTNMSHCQQYGDLSIAKLPVADFLGYKQTTAPVVYERDVPFEWTNNRDSELVMAQKLVDLAEDSVEKQIRSERLAQLVSGRQFVDNHMTAFVNSIQHLFSGESVDVFNTRLEVNEFNRECYHRFVDTFNDRCMNIAQNSYVLGKLYMFINVCENMDYSSAMDAVTYLDRYCQYNQVHGYPIEIN